MIEDFDAARDFNNEHCPVCTSCGNCCKNPPQLTMEEQRCVMEWLGQEAVDGDHMATKDGYCVAYKHGVGCLLHQDDPRQKKPTRCIGYVCTKCYQVDLSPYEEYMLARYRTWIYRIELYGIDEYI